jgi:hypothetical protein
MYIYTCIIYTHIWLHIHGYVYTYINLHTYTHTHTHTGLPGAGAEAGGEGGGHEEAEPGNFVPVSEALQLLGTHSQKSTPHSDFV